jgi:hypothetical protein
VRTGASAAREGDCRSPFGDGSACKSLAELIGKVVTVASNDVVRGGRVL